MGATFSGSTTYGGPSVAHISGEPFVTNGDSIETTFDINLFSAVAEVDLGQCRRCGECEKACPYDAVSVTPDGAAVDSHRCKGCGLCAGACPVGAIAPGGFTDREILAGLRPV